MPIEFFSLPPPLSQPLQLQVAPFLSLDIVIFPFATAIIKRMFPMKSRGCTSPLFGFSPEIFSLLT